MNYFVNENIFTMNSGTEFSAIRRLKMFLDNQIEAKIITRNYNSQLEGDLLNADVSPEYVLNMYDYFQDVVNVPSKDVNVRYTEIIDKNMYHIEGVDANETLIKHAGKTIAKVHIAPGTIGMIGSMDFLNDMNELVTQDIWDRRGFKSSTNYFHPDGTLGAQVFFDRNGRVKIEVTHMNVGDTLQPTMYKLLDYKGQNYRFNTENQLFTFFMNELAAEKPSVFINDRPSLVSAVVAVSNAQGKWQALHNAHAENNRQAGGAPGVVSYLDELFTKYNQDFDGLIVATKQQRDEIMKFHNFKQVVVLPDTFVENVRLPAVSKRNKNKIVYVGRLSYDKKPADVLEILRQVHQKNPAVEVDFYGYATPSTVQEDMNKLVEKYDLKDTVHFKGYQKADELDQALREAALLISTSESEGFGMSILDAMSYGLPVVAYDVKYGPSVLVENMVNGRLVPYGSIQTAANAVLEILDDEEKWTRFSKSSKERAKEYYEKSVWSKWKETQRKVNTLFID
ncbi:glycosyltransferase [Weissella muntiaci]|uniref:Glycosyltransferase n=1 Tax=Weissella muntiaci TaxID=2508881 RepID=A0A6C2C475_9LACO|nr:glycosyltransferase [Weissella muntiaci]TYC48356.1 glycosyltransferase [Weissella muntiaci]